MSDVTAAVAILRAAYPRQAFPDDSVRVYVRLLADTPADELVAAVERMCRRSTWLPAVAEILREVAEARLALPSPSEAWDMVTAGPAPAGPVREALLAAGGRFGIRASENLTTTRAQFLKDYAQRREDAILREIGAHPVPGLPELERWNREVEAHRVLEALPVTEHMRPRPVWARHLRRAAVAVSGRDIGIASPTDEEKVDAVQVLRWAGLSDHVGPLHREAQRIMDEATAGH